MVNSGLLVSAARRLSAGIVALASFLASEAAGDEKRLARLRPPRLRQTTKRRSHPVALGQRHVVEVSGTQDRHAVVRRQDHLRRQSTNRSGHGHDDDFLQVFQYFVSRQDQTRATLIRRPKCVPADLAALQPTSSQPSASHASGSSSLENSSRLGGKARYASFSSAPGRTLRKRRRRTRSCGVRQATRGRMSSAVRDLPINVFYQTPPASRTASPMFSS